MAVKGICIEGVCVAIPELSERGRDFLGGILDAANEEPVSQGYQESADEVLSISLSGEPGDRVGHETQYSSSLSSLSFNGLIDVTPSSTRFETLLGILRFRKVTTDSDQGFFFFSAPGAERSNAASNAGDTVRIFPEVIGALRAYGIFSKDVSTDVVIVYTGENVVPQCWVSHNRMPVVVLPYALRDDIGTVRHELLHAYLSDLSSEVVPLWFQEGFAMQVEHYGERPPRLRELGLTDETGAFISLRRESIPWSLSGRYKTVANVFFFFLEDTYGIELFARVLERMRKGREPAVDALIHSIDGIESLDELEVRFHIWLIDKLSLQTP